MPIDPGAIVLVDTNVLIEAHRAGFLFPLCTHHKIVTVETCLAETQTGYASRPHGATIPIGDLRTALSEVPPVSQLQQANLLLRLPNDLYLDEGERDLMAHALERKGIFLLCGPDKAMIRAAGRLGLLDSLVSLSEVAVAAHVSRKQIGRLNTSFCKPWLDEQKTLLLLDRR